MPRQTLLILVFALLACSQPTEPSAPMGVAGSWLSSQGSTPGGFVQLRTVVAETGGVLSGSGTLTWSGCPGSPYAVTLTGARAGAAVSFTLVPRDVNFSGTFAADSISGTLTGLVCGGISVAPTFIILRRQ